MEQNKEMTAQESLKLISETLNNSRRDILRHTAKYYVLWGCLLAAFSLIIYLLWHSTGKASWNMLWFVMPVFGYMAAWGFHKKDATLPASFIGGLTGKVWSLFGVFSVVLSAVAVFFVPMPVTFTIILLLGLAESVTGVILRNWPVIICGFIVGVGGAIAASIVQSEAQLLLFTVGGIVLAATGLIIKSQSK